MNLTVRFFARARDLAGVESLPLTLPAGATVATLRSELAAKVPALQNLLAHCAIAIDGDYAASDQVLPEGCEAALLPPVNGG